MSAVCLLSALGIKSQLKNVRFLHKLGFGGCGNLVIVNSPHITITSRRFASFRERGPRRVGFDSGAGKPADYEGALASSSQSLPGRAGPPSSNSPEDAHFNWQIERFHDSWDVLEFIDTCDPEQLSPAGLEFVSNKLIACLKNEMSATCRSSNSSEKKRVLASVGMQKLCRVTKNHGRNLSSEALITMCHLFVFLDTPGNHPTFNIVLRLLSKQKGSLSLINILNLKFVISHMSEDSKSPTSKALTLNLIPMIFQGQSSMQLDKANLPELVNCLEFAAQNNCSESELKKVLQQIIGKQKKLSYLQAQNIVWSLGNCRQRLSESDELLETSFKIIVSNIHLLKTKQLNLFLRVCVMRSREPMKDRFYNEGFAEAVCYRLIETHRETDLEVVLTCFNYITMFRHLNIDLIETIADLMAANPKAILHDDSAFYTIIRNLSDSSYKPEKWDSLKPLLLEPLAVCNELSVREIALTSDFLALDVLPVALLHRVFSPDCYSTLDRWLKKSGPQTLIMIYNAVKNLHPEYAGPMPQSSMVEHWKIMHRSIKEKVMSKTHLYPLEGALQTAFGGESYVVSGIFHEGIYIDHCVVMRQDNFPVAVPDPRPMDLEHIERPENTFLILIKTYETEAFSRNTKRLRGFQNLEAKILASFGHSVLGVDMGVYRKLMESDKIPWLRRQIRKHAGNMVLRPALPPFSLG